MRGCKPWPMPHLLKRKTVSLGHRSLRAGWLVLGFLCVGLGIIGAFVPLMPTTIFIILAAGCFARSSPRLENWLLDHPKFGPTLRAWRAHRAVPRRAKIAACVGMATGYGIFFVLVRPGLWLGAGGAVVFLMCALFLVTRPERGEADDV